MIATLKRAWHSPTISTWAYQAALSLQVLLVAPMILRHFNTIEVSAWYLFSSLNIFGSVVMQRVTLTYSRMIAMATGVRSHSSGRSVDKAEQHANTDWQLINRIVPTMGAFQVALVCANVLIAGVLGWIGLEPLLHGYAQAHEILAAFAFHQLGCIGAFYVSRYHAVLIGLNAVTTSNRLNMVTLICGLLAVAGSIHAGFGIATAAALNAMISTVGGMLARTSIRTISGGNLPALDSIHYDPNIAAKARTPIFRSLVNQLATMGVLPLAGILITRQGNAEVAAAFNFSLRILTAIEQVGLAPITSIQPKISRWMAEERFSAVHELLKTRIALSLGLMVAGMAVAGVFIPWLLEILRASTRALSLWDWSWLCAGMLVSRAYSLLLTPMFATNNITFMWHAVASAVFSILLMITGLPMVGILSVGAGMLLANVFVFRVQPYLAYRRSLAL